MSPGIGYAAVALIVAILLRDEIARLCAAARRRAKDYRNEL